MENLFDLCLCCFLLRRRGNKHFDVHFRRIGPVLFPSKDGRDAVQEGKSGWKGVYFAPESAFLPFVNTMLKLCFRICTLNWRVDNYVSRQGEGINRRYESTITILYNLVTLW